ncbi:MAG TPA: M56 family metallopeptidase [Steroidobacteraceae bacterium]|nr:M56 family metallopeptidase [Steroidobacteraceae bacterium]
MIPTVFDHLWQSTLFACGAGLLALALRRHSARARYWLWFAASVKFLVPFSLLESVGSWLAPRADVVALPQPVLDAVGRFSTPFAAIPTAATPTAATAFATTTAPISSAHAGALQIGLPHSPDITAWLAGVWLAGTIVFVAVWTARWLRLLAVVRTARAVGVEAPMPVKATPSRIEPGLVGLLRPVLLLPDGLDAHLSPQEIGTLVSHEVCHLRRRDNLTAAIHMIVEAVFWFYPLTWWLGTRLIAERERACDESVLASGHDPEVYAEGILKVCRFYVQAPLPCTAGVSGADLKKRIEVIMSSPAVRRISVATRLSIALAGLASLAGPVLYGLISAPAAGAPAATHATSVEITSPRATTSAATTPTPPQGASDIASRTYEQTRPQKEVPFNPTDFDKFAGYYSGSNGGFAHVYRTGDRYFLQLTGQPPAEFFPESPTEFFATIVAAQMSFAVGPDGRVTGMVIHQSGLLLSFPRISKAQFDAGGAELARRVKGNTPSPGARDMVLSYIQALEQGRQPNYDTMTPELAAAARQQSAQASEAIRKEGAFKSLEFSRVLPNGANMYIATFAHGQLMWVIMPLTKDGKVPGMVFRPFPP